MSLSSVVLMQGQEQRVSLLDEIENCLAQSMLIFMLADLRLLSATGRISTKYETISIDSDRVTKTSAADITGLSETTDLGSRSISPAHIMTVLFIEIMNEVEVHKGKITIPENQSGHLIEADRYDDQNRLLSLETGHLKRKAILKQAEGDMHDLLRGYARALRRDLKSDLEEANKYANTISRGNIQKKIKEMRLKHFQKSQMRLSRAKSHRLITMDALEGIQDTLLTSGVALERMNSSINDGLGASTLSMKGLEEEASIGLDDKVQMRRMMEIAVESRDFQQLHFVKHFFKEGSVSRVMAESTAQLVWLHDWFPTKECTYAISVDAVNKKVLLVFRGAITRHDWSHAFDSNLRDFPNPVKDKYEGRIPQIQLHNGFQRYLFRKRKDTGTTKYDEISGKLHEYGMAMIGSDYKIIVTGHSLGGALSTLFSLHASCEERFTRNGSIHVVSFGCPYICGYSMAHAYRYQEKVGKLRYVRVHNVRDGVPHLPPVTLQFTKHGALYHHIGIDVKLPMIRKGPLRLVPERYTQVGYTREFHPFVSWLRQAGDWYFLNTPARPWKFAQAHTLVEHQERILRINTLHTPLIYKSMDEAYEFFTTGRRKFWHATDISPAS